MRRLLKWVDDVVARWRPRCPTGLKCYAEDRAIDEAERLMDAGDVAPGCHQMVEHCRICGYWHVEQRKVVFTDLRR